MYIHTSSAESQSVPSIVPPLAWPKATLSLPCVAVVNILRVTSCVSPMKRTVLY